MKTKRKIFLLMLLIVLLATAGTLLYFFKFKEYDVADEEVAIIVEDPYTIEMPDGTPITVDAEGEVVDTTKTDAAARTSASIATIPVTGGARTTSEGTSTDGAKGEGTPSVDKAPSSTAGESSTTETTPKPTVSSIKQKYVPKLENLQSQADNKLNTLVGNAKKEYSAKKANGESISYGYFYIKYVGAANGLEARTDTVFAGVIKAVEKDLAANGYDNSLSKNLVDEYNAKKKARKDSLLNKIIGL